MLLIYLIKPSILSSRCTIFVHDVLQLQWCFFLPYSDSALTLQNVIAALKDVKDWSSLGVWLDVPKSRRDAMTGIEMC